ncbi:hypothetical protein CMV_016945 [Castanea mollissima]|uniref:Uncharacterized protein n=1 Tax=Castanea mollissima TaxID=60419 RepID=A0A8J4R5V0_9ROSI|nr:hypothetical protein CMV_016945 [Castanea mollissima]
MKVWEESPYGEWLRATEDVPPQSHPRWKPQRSRHRRCRNGTQQNSSSGHGHSYQSRTIIEEGIPEIMDVVECTGLKGPDINEEQYWDNNDGKNPEIDAIPAPQNCMLGKSSSGSMLKWLEQILDYLKLLLSQGYGRLCDAFRMLLTNPTVKRLVVSVASNKAFWDVILWSMSLQEFQWTPYAELIEKFRTLVNELFQPKSNNPTEGNKE